MNSFIGLLKKEHIAYFSAGIILFGVVLLIVSLGPFAIYEYYENSTIHNNRFILIISCYALIGVHSLYHFMASLRGDIQKKELWLHSQHSIVTLIFAKALYQALQLFVLCSITFIGFFFVGDELTATSLEMLGFFGYTMFITFAVYALFIILLLCFYTVGIQLQRFIGKLSGVVTFVLAVLFLKVSEKIPSNPLPFGKISTHSLNSYLPEFKDYITIVFMDVYVIQELAYILLYIVLFVVACKWIERVITR